MLAGCQRLVRGCYADLIPTCFAKVRSGLCVAAAYMVFSHCEDLSNLDSLLQETLTRVLLAAEIPGFMLHAYSSSTACQTRPLAAACEPGRGQNLHW